MAAQLNNEFNGLLGDGPDPRLPPLPNDDDSRDYEELYPSRVVEMQVIDIVLLAVRCGIIGFFLVGLVLTIVSLCKNRHRFKSWRLFLVVAFVFLCWLGLALFQDHIDEFFVQQIYRFPQRRSIYWFCRNLVHGMTLYLILLLLCHLSDFQYRIWWFLIIFATILVPLSYSIGLLIIDLRLVPEKRFSWQWNIGIETVHVFMYNVLSTVLLIAFSQRFCTRHLFGTFLENRSPVVVFISRWTFGFLLVHNLTAIASYGAAVTSRIPIPTWALIDVDTAIITHRALEEAILFLLVLAVPFAYLVAVTVQACFGELDETDVDQDKVDKIYDEVWIAPSGRRVTKVRDPTLMAQQQQQQQQLPTNLTTPQRTSQTSLNVAAQSGGQRSRHGSNGSLGPSNFVMAHPSGGGSAAAAAAARRHNAKKNRESYMEAISMGSMAEDDRPYSRTSDPVDL